MMRRGVGLTDSFVSIVKPGIRRREIADLGAQNLVLVVHPSGRKTWTWRGQMQGRSFRATLGRFPTYQVKEARRWAEEITAHRAQGSNIVAARREAEERIKRHDAMSCDWGFEVYMREQGGKVKRPAEKWRIYRREVAPIIGHISIHRLRHEDIMPILRKKAETAPIQSNHIRTLIKTWLHWSATHGRDLTHLQMDPSGDLPKLGKVVTRRRFLSDYELSLLLWVLDTSTSAYVEPYRFILHTGCRRAEAFEMTWAELSELESHGHWRLPAERSKNGEELLLPLPQVLIDLLKRRRIDRDDNALVWPTKGGSGGGMSGFSKALRGFESAMSELAREDGNVIPHWTAHDLRRTFITRMHGLTDRMGRRMESDAIFSITNHKQGGIRATYNRYRYYAEKRELLEAWALFLDSLRLSDHRQLSLF